MQIKKTRGHSIFYTGYWFYRSSLPFEEIDNNEVKVSIRSKNEIDVSKICNKFDGGGHIRAAGCTIYDKIHIVKVNTRRNKNGFQVILWMELLIYLNLKV